MSHSLAIAHAKALSSIDTLNAFEAVIVQRRMIEECRTMERVLRLRVVASLGHLLKAGASLDEITERTGLSEKSIQLILDGSALSE